MSERLTKSLHLTAVVLAGTTEAKMRYQINFPHSAIGIVPVFTLFKKLTDLTNQTAPSSFVEIGGGAYYFDYVPTFDVTFEVDGGAGIATEVDRYVKGVITTRDGNLDEPVSQVKTDVLGDMSVWGPGTKGLQIDTITASPSAAVVASAVWNENMASHSTAGTSGLALSTIGSEVTPSAIAAAVWDGLLSAHVTAGTTGLAINAVLKILKNRSKIDTVAKTLVIYDDNGTTPLYTYYCKDAAGVANAINIFERAVSP